LRRTRSTPPQPISRPAKSNLEPLQRYGAAVLTQIGLSPKQAAPLLLTTTKSVRKWSEAFEDNGDVEDDCREGRPKALDADQCEEIVLHAVKKPKLSTPKAVKRTLNLDVSAKTIRRVMDEAGLFGRIARVIPPMTEATLKKRLSFANGYLNFDFTKVLWSDEMSIRLGPQGQTWVQRPLGEAFNPVYCMEKEKHPPKIHVWGCMSAAGVGRIHVFTENLTGELYKEILKQHLMKSVEMFWPTGIWHFQQDNDPKHTSKIVSAYLTEQLCIKDEMITWPPYSPDLNPIENLWADLKKRVEKHNCRTAEELEIAVKEEWEKTDKDLCKKLVGSMKKRCQLVIELEGWPTGY
jgi:transposase